MTKNVSTWVLHGPHWSLPISALPFENMARVRPAGLLTASMLKAVEARFAELGTHNGQDWFLTRETLERHADYINPLGRILVDDLISWVRPTGRAVPCDQPEGMEGFFEEFARAGHAKTAAEAQLRYGAWCLHLLDWLVNKRKPVDLGFAVLDPLPVRADWREVVAFKLRIRVWGAGKGKTWADDLNRAKDWLCGNDVLMYSRENDCLLWTLNVRHKKPWWRAIIATERDRRRKRRRIGYFTDGLKFLKAKLDPLVAHFMDYVAQTRRPAVRFQKGVVESRSGPITKPSAHDVERRLRYRRHSMALDLRTGNRNGAKNVAFKGSKLSKVRDLPEGDENVRSSGGDVDESRNGSV